MNFEHLPTRSRTGKGFHVVVESPRGSQVKIKYDPELLVFKLSRPLVLGLSYPYDWGFIPGTRAPDGDPLDAMLLSDQSTYPGVVVECRAIAVIQLCQNRKKRSGRERNDRILAVPLHSPRFAEVRTHTDIPIRLRQEIERFFLTAVVFENKDATILRWGSGVVAEKLVDASATQGR